MTDTKESNYQDVADLRAENAKLRAEVDFANERAGKAEHELESVKKREKDGVELFDGIVAELRAELDALRQQAEAAAPSDEEIEAWRKTMQVSVGFYASKDPSSPRFDYGEQIDRAVALMRRAHGAVEPDDDGRMILGAPVITTRASAAPAQSALREAAKDLCKDAANAIVDYGEEHDLRDLTKSEAACRAALAAEPPAPSAAAGVAVPEDVRRAAVVVDNASVDEGEPFVADAMICASWILSLAAAPQQPQADGPKPVSDEWERGWNAHVKHASAQQPQAAEPDAELKLRYEAVRDHLNSRTATWNESKARVLLQDIGMLVEALARKAGCK